MAASATVRDLRNHFPKIKKLVEEEGEVIVTDQGTPKYRLIRYTPADTGKAPAAKDYVARLRRHQRRPLSAAAARALHDANRGER
jgi:antitoxin (DNA-binding transcriptional repressor) of toxin-antitoxin stability system